MGLDTTHDCWHGPYSAFHRFRCALADARGINLDAMDGFSSPGVAWDAIPAHPLDVLLNHSDCDGKIEHAKCADLAAALLSVAPMLEPPWDARARQFAEGLTRAYRAIEDVEFH